MLGVFAAAWALGAFAVLLGLHGSIWEPGTRLLCAAIWPVVVPGALIAHFLIPEDELDRPDYDDFRPTADINHSRHAAQATAKSVHQRADNWWRYRQPV